MTEGEQNIKFVKGKFVEIRALLRSHKIIPYKGLADDSKLLVAYLSED